MFDDLMSSDILKEMTECINEAIEVRDELSQKLKEVLSQRPLVMACIIFYWNKHLDLHTVPVSISREPNTFLTSRNVFINIFILLIIGFIQ